jgi:hypothetical protein
MFGKLLVGLALLTLAGCYRVESGTKPSQHDKGPQAEGHHHGPGPHGGVLVEWGEEEYHPEFTVNHEKQEATVYILDGTGKKEISIPAKSINLQLKNPVVQIELLAAPQKGDPEGTSSRFIGKHEALGKEMEFEGTIDGVVDGKPYSGKFKEEPEKPMKKDS